MTTYNFTTIGPGDPQPRKAAVIYRYRLKGGGLGKPHRKVLPTVHQADRWAAKIRAERPGTATQVVILYPRGRG